MNISKISTILAILPKKHKRVPNKIRGMFFSVLASVIFTGVFTVFGFGQKDANWKSPLSLCWEFRLENMSKQTVASDNVEGFYFHSPPQNISSLQVSTSAVNWSANLGNNIQLVKFLNRENILIVSFGNGTNQEPFPLTEKSTIIKLINPNTGVTTHTIPIQRKDFPQSVSVIFRGDIFYFSMSDGSILAFSISQKRVLWSVNIAAEIITKPVIIGGNLIFATSNKTLASISTVSGEIASQLNIERLPSGKKFGNKEVLYLGDQLGNVTALKTQTGKELWNTKTGGGIADIDGFRDDVIVTSNDNFVYRLSSRSGRKKWKTRLAGRFVGKTFLDENTATFISSGSSTAVIINLINGKIINRIEIPEDMYFVSPPIKTNSKVIFPTQKGFLAYSSKCNEKRS